MASSIRPVIQAPVPAVGVSIGIRWVCPVRRAIANARVAWANASG